MLRLILTSALLLLTSQPLVAQDYDELASEHPEATEAEITSTADVYEEPKLVSDRVAQLEEGDSVLAYEVIGDWFKIATREDGPLGYISHTVPSTSAESVPESLVRSDRSEQESQSRTQTPLQATAQPVKDPDMALIFSILLTGGGHLYAGETRTGALLLGSSIT